VPRYPMGMLIIKKYGNRRLYDTASSSYVTQAEIAAKIRAGEDVRVINAKTGADLTASTLAQIIFEDRHAAQLLPTPLLLQLIRMGEDSLAEFLGRYVSWALELYLQARQGMGGLPFNPFAPAAFGSMNPFAGGAGNHPRGEPPPRARANDREDELAGIRRELEELKKSLRKTRR
jgi:polyhydroxyalkanoate synthesis repressor PhaR